uniref:Uncharacterized protein n=1 Tax=Sinocyclocheilus anshuiensis TaxID=1608454 RepID=A0A671RYQ0_9TELE
MSFEKEYGCNPKYFCRLSGCSVTEEGCAALASALSSNPSHLRELDLSNNDLQDSGVKLLCAGLKSPNCQLNILGYLVVEEIPPSICAALASALSSNPSHLRELDLSYNHPGESGVKLLSETLNHLDTLKDSMRTLCAIWKKNIYMFIGNWALNHCVFDLD